MIQVPPQVQRMISHLGRRDLHIRKVENLQERQLRGEEVPMEEMARENALAGLAKTAFEASLEYFKISLGMIKKSLELLT